MAYFLRYKLYIRKKQQHSDQSRQVQKYILSSLMHAELVDKLSLLDQTRSILDRYMYVDILLSRYIIVLDFSIT